MNITDGKVTVQYSCKWSVVRSDMHQVYSFGVDVIHLHVRQSGTFL